MSIGDIAMLGFLVFIGLLLLWAWFLGNSVERDEGEVHPLWWIFRHRK